MRSIAWKVLVSSLACAAGLLKAADGNAYLQHNLVADTPGIADFTDPNLVNGWGIAASATGPFWVNDGGTGLSTVYTSTGSISATKAIVPPSHGGSSPSVATGIVFNGTGGFAIATGKAPTFIFATADGAISGWSPTVDATHAVLKVDRSSDGAVYTGLAISSGSTGPYLYAANFHSGSIDVFDTNYNPVNLSAGFADAAVPSGFAPFNIQNLGGKLYVTYARQDDAKRFDVPGVGNGYVAVFDLNGKLLQHLVSNGPLNSPWGVAIAPLTFGAFPGALLVGNFGDGLIDAFDPATGASLGALQDLSGAKLRIPGLWGLYFGNGGNGGDVNALYFAAGPANQKHGLFGSIQAAPVISTASVANAAGPNAGIAANTWVAIYGANLSATTRAWKASDFKGNSLPTALDGVSVTINGQPAYVFYISPKQVDVLFPAGVQTGAAQVVTSNNGLAGASTAVNMQLFAPAFFLFGGKYVAATHSDNRSLIGPTTLLPNLTTPAKPGETVVIYGTGFGPTTPPIPDGQIVTQAAALASPVTISIDGIPVQPVSAVLSGAGLYQFNVKVPESARNGDLLVFAQVGGYTSPGSVYITVQQ